MERFTVSDDSMTLTLEYTLEDPGFLTEPYSSSVVWDRLTADAPIFSFECDVDAATRSTLNAAPL